jgi:4-oxalocrotonate tautomerase
VVKTPMHGPETHEFLAKLHPVGRMGEVRDIVDAVLYLEGAAFVTGEILHVDGGQSAGHWEGIITMPIVTIQVTREGTTSGAASVTSEQKTALIKGASQLLLDVLNKPLEATFVVIEEVEMENWGWGGLPVAEYRKKLAKAASA